MKYGFVLRKLIINNIVYYQVVDKIKGKVLDGDKIEVVEGTNYLGKDIFSIDSSFSELSYIEIPKEEYEKYNFQESIFLKLENKELIPIENINENNMVAERFFNHYKDFLLIPEYDLKEVVLDAKSKLKEKLLGQDAAINKIINKIYSNQMFLQADIDHDQKIKHKSNILVIAPIGSGKTTIKDVLMENLNPIPVVEVFLTGNLQEDFINMLKKIMYASNGNLFLASRAIVIYDGISSLCSKYINDQDGYINLYIDELEKIMSQKLISFKKNDDDFQYFDTSLLTHLCLIDLDYDKRVEEDIIYSDIHPDDLNLLGINPNFLGTYFDDEIIFMNNISKELALKILKDKKISPLLTLKNTYESKGYKVHFEKEFVNKLIEYGLNKGEGMTGIIELLKYVLQAKDFTKNSLIFKAKDFDDLKVGTCIYDALYDEDLQDEDYSVVSDNQNENKSLLKVDVKKRTINNLTVMDTVNKIKENIKGQDEQIFILVNAFFNHILNKFKKLSPKEKKELKENVLLLGSTGVGKTAMVENLANIFNLTYQREIATRYSAAGYVGEDVDNMLLDLMIAANGDINKAQNGILYIDEIDKIKVGEDKFSMGLAVQNQLLTLIEGDKRVVRNRHDAPFEFDTSGLFVIGTGAFDGLEEIVKARVKKESGNQRIGFQEDKKIPIERDFTTDDLVNYGYDRQFIGRFSHQIKLNNLDENILLEIINNSKEGYVNLCKKSYLASSVTIKMSEEFKRKLARQAKDKKMGARGIKTIFKKIKDEIDKNIQAGDISEVILDENSLDNPSQITYIKRKKL